MSKEQVLAVDLGGTKITAGVVDPDGRVTGRRTIPTGAQRGPAAIVADLVALLGTLQAAAPEARLIGIGSAGVVDPQDGSILSATDAIPGWTGTPLAERIGQGLEVPAFALNDVHAHALGEARHGAGADRASMLMVAVGTGVGGGFVEHGRVKTGARAVAGHVGHMPVPEAAGMDCTCGRSGHLEAVGSGPAILAAYRRRGGAATDTREIAARAEAGEELAREVLTAGARAVGRTVGALLNVLDPEIVVLSGGMAAAGELWWSSVREGVGLEAMDRVADAPVVPAAAGAEAALLGAAQYARDRAADTTV
ncbi:ROK family protein [Brachybacterium sp. p3-SID1565]|uniref:ROK family protein n=1 Tax=Brachybacterium sp. p3-SID1565 TaxID=2916046 RepID=UPI0021A769FB|nr:ROK family protein [Brachybacterium sp. p3-SID1565]MCT1386239.1 ROK family protein [Brachybacterium sp. p3-SID1565]